jgi:manganese transport protein
MLAVAASVFHRPGAHADTIQAAHSAFSRVAGSGAGLAFALALLASGLAASSVGTQAGQVVMQGFLRRRIPLYVRRLVTMAPSLAVLAIGLDPTKALVLSQVVLSFGIPFALVPLVVLTGRAGVMGKFRNHPSTAALAWTVAAVVTALNVFLIVTTIG